METLLKKTGTIALALFICTASSCIKEQPCPVYEDRHYHISEEEMAYVPYSGHDTLTFLRFEGNHVDTITFAGQGIQEYIEYDSYGYGEHHCDGRILKHSVYTDYVSNDSLGNFKYRFKVIPEKANSVFFVEIDPISVSGLFVTLNSPNSSRFIPILTIDSLTFYNVAMSANKPHIHTHRIYYNVEHGVVRLELRDSTIVYQLIP